MTIQPVGESTDGFHDTDKQGLVLFLCLHVGSQLYLSVLIYWFHPSFRGEEYWFHVSPDLFLQQLYLMNIRVGILFLFWGVG